MQILKECRLCQARNITLQKPTMTETQELTFLPVGRDSTCSKEVNILLRTLTVYSLSLSPSLSQINAHAAKKQQQKNTPRL